MKLKIEKTIREVIAESGLSYYREPLVGYAWAEDPLFPRLKELVGPGHLLPQNILPGARSVLAFFLPFAKEVIQNNRQGQIASREWAEVYIQTNRLIGKITLKLKSSLATQKVKMESQPPTYVFHPDLLVATWSHKHVAYICGLGVFGQNHLLITSKGCGGRFGTAVLDVYLEPSSRPEQTHRCRYQSDGCRYCREICSVKALNEPVFQRRLCYRHCRQNDQIYHDLEKFAANAPPDLADISNKLLPLFSSPFRHEADKELEVNFIKRDFQICVESKKSDLRLLLWVSPMFRRGDGFFPG